MPLGRLGGVRLYLDPLLPVLLVLIGFSGVLGADTTRAVLSLGAFLFFVALHEIAHAWMARRRGLTVRGIYLHVLPVTYVQQGEPADEWRVALMGPVVNLVLGAVLLAIWIPTQEIGRPSDLRTLLADPLALCAVLNLAIGVLNLLPFLPADGGRVLRALVAIRSSMARARTVVAWSGYCAAALLLALALALAAWPMSAYLAVVAAYLVFVGYREMSAGRDEPESAATEA